VAEKLWDALKGLPDWLVVMVLSAAPISEVRGGIPVGYAYYRMPMWEVFVLAVVAAVVSVLWVVPLYNWMATTFDRTPVLGAIFRWLTHHAQKRQAAVDRYGVAAVTLFVAVPFPGFGGWSGSVLAAVCGFSFWKFTACLVVGTIIASGIMVGLTLGGVEAFSTIHVAPQAAP
jgi:uncharacterized membrane protein